MALRLSKKKRAELREKYGGKGAYCGHELNQRWQADHVEPVQRISEWKRQENGRMKCVPTGAMARRKTPI